jgi:hypothetical protein
VQGSELHDYPRAHFLSTKEVSTAGMLPITGKVNHFSAPGTWATSAMAFLGGSFPGQFRTYGSSVLFPISSGGGIKDILVSNGGQNAGGVILSTYEWTNAGVATPTWVQAGSINQPRWFLNSVLLPDSTIVAVGGEQQYAGFGCSEVPALVPEIFVGGQWVAKAPGSIIRDYHSVALLLPSGKVFVGGGESRRYAPWPNCSNTTGRSPTVAPADYQIFVPPSLACGGPKPVIQGAPGSTFQWSYGSQQTVSYTALPFGITIQKVALLRAGSVTHHCDPNQRCLELAFTILPDTDPPTGYRALQLALPSKASYLLPRGHYMLFLLTNQRIPSVAAWVNVF